MNRIFLFSAFVILLGCVKKEAPISISSSSISLMPVRQSTDSVFLQWNAQTAPSFRHYIVLRSWNGAAWSYIATNSGSSNTTFTDIQIMPDWDLRYKVVAEFSNGDTVESNIQPIKTDPLKIDLDPLQITNDSIILNWHTNYTKYAPGQYFVFRKVENMEKTERARIYDIGKTTYTDKDIPYTTNITYEVVFKPQYNSSEVKSVERTYQRKEIKMADIKAFDVLYDAEKKLIYFFNSTGEIKIFDIAADKITHSVNAGVVMVTTGPAIGYSDLATFNNEKELYVPTADGRIIIYDALTLAMKSQIQVGNGISTHSVFFNNGLIFADTDAWMNNPLRVFSRTGRNLVEQGGFWNSRMIKKIPGSNTEMVEVAMYPSGLALSYYSFNSSGKILTQLKDVEMNSYDAHGKIFEMLGSNGRFITSEAGNIFSKDLLQVGQLQNINKKFGSYAVDNTSNEIYAGTNEKTIEVYSLSNYQHLRTIHTKYYPFKVFKTGNQIISTGTLYKRDSNFDIPEKLFIELL